MADVIASISTAIGLVSQINSAAKKVKDAEFKNLLADLSLELADAKMKIVDLLEENTSLREKAKALENAEGDPCPKCRKRGWELVNSRPDPVFGAAGGIRRAYKCSICGFLEERLVTS